MNRMLAAPTAMGGAIFYCAGTIFLSKITPPDAFPWLFFAFLLPASVITGWGMSRSAGINPNLDWALHSSLMFFVPAYGILGSAALFGHRIFVPHKAPEAEGDPERAQAERDHRRAHMATGSIEEMVRQELEVQSYFDIIRGNNRILKKALIGKIINQWTANSVQILKIALRDPEYDVRSYASTALSELENRMSKSIIEQKEEVRKDPGLVGLRLKLAKSYLNYADSGLLDASSSEHYIRSAKSILDDTQESLNLDDRSRVQILTLRAFSARIESDDASERSAYDAALLLDPSNQEALIHLCGVQFQAREFANLRTTVARLLGVIDRHHPAYQSAVIWRDASVDAAGDSARSDS